ncbi:glycosyltransferase family 2 protein [Thioalkalivibrio thiocyanodenitrificans]|uniref:glycosyltransferase family 2 protein n=1 Tax=Thioalkalivibrio thiocyanodenitrificans TaxID=243063 RepID=UPI000376AFBF|nr:glycosyltransferase family A protein [Thioalkalivibrio thiocyanodenitrificans]
MPVGNPRISVIIPVYNGERYLAAALESVVNQTFRTAEIIVVDDGSSDGSHALCAGFPGIRTLRQKNLGVAAARNAGVRASTGDFLAFLDQDDTWTSNKLELQSDYLARNPEYDFALGMQRLFLDPEVTEPPAWLRAGHLDKPQLGYLPGTLLCARAVFDRVGPFDTRYRFGGDDADWFARAEDLGLHRGVVNETVLMRRIHADNLSAMTQQGNRELTSLLHASILRKRGKAPGGVRK